MLGAKRIVVTGLGVVAPNGIGKVDFWDSVVAGRSAIGPITLFPTDGLRTTIAGEVRNFDILQHVDLTFKPSRLGRFTQFALAATQFALDDASISEQDLARAGPVFVALGVSTSDTEIIEQQVLRIDKGGHKNASPFTAIASLPQAAAGAIAEVLKVQAQALTVSTGCPAGLDAVASAVQEIRAGRFDLANAGGADAPITVLTVATFCAAGGMSTRNEDPEHASRPFDKLRDGGLIAEGAGIVVLEEMDHALARGANPLLEVAGYGAGCDPDPQNPASGLKHSMETALNNAGCRPDDIDYICAHGPSDPVLDRVETAAIKQLFGKKAYSTPVSSIKGVTGNPLAAAGPMQLVACAEIMRTGWIPPTANYEVPDPHCDLDYVPISARRADVRYAMINNHGFGGSNSSLLVKRIRIE